MGLLDMLNPFGGGGGSSSFSSGGIGNSKSANETNNQDASVVGGEGSTNSSQLITGSNNTLTDHGAVSMSMQLALAGVHSAQQLAEQAQAAQGTILTGALKTVSDQQSGFTSALENIKTSDVRVLIIAAIAAVALIGFRLAGSNRN